MSYTRLVIANLLRNKLRTAFTAGAITLAVVLVCLLLTMPAALDRLLESAASDVRISVHHKAGLVYSMPERSTAWRPPSAWSGTAGRSKRAAR